MPITFKAAAEFVAAHHRHHRPPLSHKFSVAVAEGDEVVGVVMVGRPVARHYDDGLTLEANRTCVLDGVRNANSMLYGTAWRVGKALGYRRMITYTQEGESGASLRAVGWLRWAERPARPGWDTPTRRRSDRGVDQVARTLWMISRDGELDT